MLRLRWRSHPPAPRDHLRIDSEENEDTEAEARAEPRWPMAAAVITAGLLTVALPTSVRLAPAWFLPTFEVVLLIALIAGDPGRVTRTSKALRFVSTLLVAVLALGSLTATAFLIDGLISGASYTNDAGPLLAAGVKVWVGNGLAFCLLFWELDDGGPVARLHAMPASPDFAFPQQLAPEVAPAGWRPRFVDYVYLSITNSIAFSPTDTMPLVAWAKMAMALQAIVSFSIVGLVIARAVNVFS